MKRAFSFIAVWISSAVCFAGAGDEPTFKVISVIDGNTIELVTDNGEQFQILLHGVDSPDEGQSFSTEAKSLLAKLLLNKVVTLIDHGKDRRGTRIAEVTAKGVPDPQRELVRTGLAWTTAGNEELESLKEHARKQGLGIWTDENPMPPWLYRRQQSMMAPKQS